MRLKIIVMGREIMEDQPNAQVPRNWTDMVGMVQKDKNCSRTDAMRFIWDGVMGRKEKENKPPDIQEMVQTQQTLKGISTGERSKMLEDYTSAMLNTLQMKSIGEAMGGGAEGGRRGGNFDDKFDRLLMMRMLPKEDNGMMQMMMVLLPLLLGGNNQDAVQQAMAKLEGMAKETESKYSTLVSDLQNKLFQKEVVDRGEVNQANMIAFMQEIATSNERVVGSLSGQLANLQPNDGNTQVQAALTTLGAYQDFMKNTTATLQGLGLSPGEAAAATEEATAGKAKNYLMTQIGNFLGGMGQSFLQGSVSGPPLPPGYQGPPQQLNYYPPPTGHGMPQPTYDPNSQPAPSFPPQQPYGAGVPNGPEGMTTQPVQQGVVPPPTQPPSTAPPAESGMPPMPQQKPGMPRPTFEKNQPSS